MTMPCRTLRRFILGLSLLAGAGAASLSSGARAQSLIPEAGLPAPGDGFTWERVGDQGISVQDLHFGPDTTLWAVGANDPYRLDLSEGFPGRWILVEDYPFLASILALGRGPTGDTLIAANRGVTWRSLDGGHIWTVVHNRGGEALLEIPAGLPHAGRILTGSSSGTPGSSTIGYSDDRGATFTAASVPSPDGQTAGVEDFAAFPPGSPHAGRVLAAGRWGVTVSDDGGATWYESALWRAVYYRGWAAGTLSYPVSGALVGGMINALSDAQVWASADGGTTWDAGAGGMAGLELEEAPPNDGFPEAVLPLGGASALVVLEGGTVYRTDDAGQTWAAIGRAPEISTGIFLDAAVLGPDHRLYVGLAKIGLPDGWAWRTRERFAAAPVPVEPRPEEGGVLGVEVSPNPSAGGAEVVVTLAAPGEVAASVYSVLGRRVAVLHEGLLGAGEHAFDLDTHSLPTGVYVVRVAAGSEAASQAVTVLR